VKYEHVQDAAWDGSAELLIFLIEARWLAGPQTGVVAVFSSVRVSVGEGAMACRSTARRRH